MNTKHDGLRVDRRTAIKWVIAAGAALRLPAVTFEAGASPTAASGYGKDPELLRIYAAGDLWPLTFTDEQRRLVATLCDLIIPADDESPAASAVGVVDFLDEWISAPYPDHARDRQVITEGLSWLDAESGRRFGARFIALSAAQTAEICDDISKEDHAKPQFAQAAHFFARYRSLTAGGFYTTTAGRKDLRYVGNVALSAFEGPPPEVLKRIGLA